MTYADNSRHYGFYIDGDIAKLPGGGRKGAAVLCELLPDQLAEDPNQQRSAAAADSGAYPDPQPPYQAQPYPYQSQYQGTI